MSSRAKGRKYENEAGKLMGGKRISQTGLAGADVEDGKGNLVEVKYRRSLPASLVEWMRQRDDQDCEYLMIKQARGKWQVVIDAELFRDKYLKL